MKKFLLFFVVSLSFISSSFALSPYASIEDEIFDMQKGWIKEVKDTLEIDTTKGMKQDGAMTLSAKIVSPSASGSLKLGIDNYTITLDAKTGNTTMSYAGRLNFDMTSSDYRYDSVKDSYSDVPVHAMGTVDFSVDLTQAKGDTYMTLKSLTWNFSGDAQTKDSFDSALKKITKYIGKTYKIPGNVGTKWNSEDAREMLQKAFIILETKPLFTVVNQNKDASYKLKWNRDTLKALGMKSMRTTTDIINYRNIGSVKSLTFSPKRNAKNNFITLSENAGAYSLIGKIYEKKKYNLTDINFSLTKDAMSFIAKDKDSTTTIDWKLGKLIVDYNALKTDWEDAKHFHIEGRLIPNLRDIDLSFFWQEKKIGSLNSIKGSDGSINYNMNVSIVESLWSVIFDLAGHYRETKGDYSILPPKIYELLD